MLIGGEIIVRAIFKIIATSTRTPTSTGVLRPASIVSSLCEKQFSYLLHILKLLVTSHCV